jgi:hypothetical protein
MYETWIFHVTEIGTWIKDVRKQGVESIWILEEETYRRLEKIW